VEVRLVIVLAAALTANVAMACARGDRPSGPAACCVSPAPRPSSAGGADSAVHASARSPEEAWRKLLAAMRAGDEAAIASHATSAGVASLEAGAQEGAPPVAKKVAFARLGEALESWEVRWNGSERGDRAEAALGPTSKEHGLAFVRTAEGWKLDRWTRGD
jgi:hypothetical protein